MRVSRRRGGATGGGGGFLGRRFLPPKSFSDAATRKLFVAVTSSGASATDLRRTCVGAGASAARGRGTAAAGDAVAQIAAAGRRQRWTRRADMSMLVAARRGATEWLGATNAHATERTQAMRVERSMVTCDGAG